MNELTYRQVGDYLFPNINLPQQSTRPLNKYGRMRKRFLREHQPLIFQTMLLNGTLTSHLQEIGETAEFRLEQMLEKMAKEANVAEEFKAADPMRWVQMMNGLKAQAEEILLAELVYA